MQKYWTVSDIINYADKKYSLNFKEGANGVNKQDNYAHYIRNYLKKKGYCTKKPYRIPSSLGLGLVEHELSSYFIKNSRDTSSLQNDKELKQQKERQTQRILNHPSNPEFFDELSTKPLIQVINELKNDDYPDPMTKIKNSVPSGDEDAHQFIEGLEKEIKKAKKDFIFHALLELTNQKFDEVQLIKDYLQRELHTDYSTRTPTPRYGFSKYDKKLQNPYPNYFKK